MSGIYKSLLLHGVVLAVLFLLQFLLVYFLIKQHLVFHIALYQRLL